MIDPSQLGITSTNRRTVLYVEGIDPSASVADQRLLVEVDPDGGEPLGYMVHDAVRASVVKVDLRDGGDNDKQLVGGSVAWITPEPVMPDLRARLLPNLSATLGDSAKWVLRTTFNKASPTGGFVRPTSQTVTIPQLGPGGATVTRDLPVDSAWDIASEYQTLPAEQSYFGGDALLTVSVGPTLLQTIRFFIRGRNPDPDAARIFIQSRSGAPWYAYAVAKHESQSGARNRFYNQFNELGTFNLALEGTPNWGTPEGWGVFQVEYRSGARDPVHLWNWQSNVELGVTILAHSAGTANTYMAGQRAAAVDPNGQPVAVPDDPVPNCYFSDGAGSHHVEDAVAIKWYNTGEGGTPYVRWNRAAMPPQWEFHRVNYWTDSQGNLHPNPYVAHVCSQVE